METNAKNRLIAEIRNEHNQIHEINGTIKELEAAADELEGNVVGLLDEQDPIAAKWKVRYEAQVRVNEKLDRERLLLQRQLEIEKAKLRSGWMNYPYMMELDNNMTEVELQRLVRQLEMVKDSLSKELRDNEWQLDHQSKQYHELNDLCDVYRSEIFIAKNDAYRMRQHLFDDISNLLLPPKPGRHSSSTSSM